MPGSKPGYFNSVLTDKGIPLAATITVFDQGTATPSTIYADAGGVTPLANPFSTDAIGRFQFYAATGKYDVQVSGAGITTYKIENISLALTGPAGPEAGIRPEDYGAVGDGVTDDYAAFLAMFADLAPGGAYAGTVRRKIILNPAVYYCIKTRTDATNVFLIDVDNLIMEGPGMGIKTIAYEGVDTGVLFKLTNCQLVTFYGVRLDAVSGSGDVFEIDDFSTLVLDKTVMDLMSPFFSGLCNKPHRIKFSGYTDKPTAGVFDVGCVIDFEDGSSGYRGCICTVAGNPGTWVYYGATV